MEGIRALLYFAVSLGASIIGAICGVGGGVIVKPLLDLFHWDGVATIRFLSGCMVLAMSAYSVGRSFLARERAVALRSATPLALGAAAGGVLGSLIFSLLRARFADPDLAGAIQALLLSLIMLGTLLYTLCKKKITPHKVESLTAYLLIGLSLGLISSFLGIGGGPINLVVLHFFFGMESKRAAANSLYVILFSQLTTLITTLVEGVPPFDLPALLLMIAGAIGGGIIGRSVNRKIDNAVVDRLFAAFTAVIVLIGAYNAVRYGLM